jgi:hypothetical protein
MRSNTLHNLPMTDAVKTEATDTEFLAQLGRQRISREPAAARRVKGRVEDCVVRN